MPVAPAWSNNPIAVVRILPEHARCAVYQCAAERVVSDVRMPNHMAGCRSPRDRPILLIAQNTKATTRSAATAMSVPYHLSTIPSLPLTRAALILRTTCAARRLSVTHIGQI